MAGGLHGGYLLGFGSIGGLDEEVSIDLARYKMGHDDVPVLDSFRTVVND